MAAIKVKGGGGHKKGRSRMTRSAGIINGPVAALLSAGIFLSLLNLAVLQWQLGDGGLREMLHRRISSMSRVSSRMSSSKAHEQAEWGGGWEEDGYGYGYGDGDGYGYGDEGASTGRDFVSPRPRARVLSWAPRVFEIPGLVSREDCERLIRKAEARLEFVGTQGDGKHEPPASASSSSSAKRRSESMWFNAARDDEDDLVATVRARLLDAALMPSQYSEPLQVTRYSEGDFYDLHYDFSQPNRQEASSAGNPGLYPHGDVERSATLVLYLSEGFSGGETVFPRIASRGSPGNGLLETVPRAGDEVWKTPPQSLDYFCGDESESDALRVKPGIGGAILFFGYSPSGERDMDTIHGSCPVRSGVKVIAQQWIQLNLRYATSQTLEDRLKRLSDSSKEFRARAESLHSASMGGRQHHQEQMRRGATISRGFRDPVEIDKQQKLEGGEKVALDQLAEYQVINEEQHRHQQQHQHQQQGGHDAAGPLGKGAGREREMPGNGNGNGNGGGDDAIVTVVSSDLAAVQAAALARSVMASDEDAWKESIGELGEASRPTTFDLVALVISTSTSTSKSKSTSTSKSKSSEQGVTSRGIGILKSAGWRIEILGKEKEEEEEGEGQEAATSKFPRIFAWNLKAERVLLVDAASLFLKDPRAWFQSRYWQGKAFNAVASKVGFQGHVLGLRPSKEAFDRLVAASSSFEGNEEAFIASSIKQPWEAVPEDQRFSRTALLVSSLCGSRAEAWPPLTVAGLVTFGGESKPWDWPEAVRGGEACKAMRAFAVLWQLIVLSPSMAEVRNTLQRFDDVRRDLIRGKSYSELDMWVPDMLESIGEYNAMGGSARQGALRSMCEARLFERRVPVQAYSQILYTLCGKYTSTS